MDKEVTGREMKNTGFFFKKTKKQLENAGSTLIEVIVGFVLLTIIMTSFFGIISLSSDLTVESADKIKARQEYEEKYYLEYGSSFDEETILEASSVKMTECNSEGEPVKKGAEIVLNHAELVKITAIDEKTETMTLYALRRSVKR